MSDRSIKPLVFLSYGRESRADAEFARGLAERLRRVGFEVWLEEEHESPGSAPGTRTLEGIRNARHAIFIVSKAWIARPDLRSELELLAGHPAETHRRIAVRCEPIDEPRLATDLQGLPSVDWRPDDPEPDARFWEVYCGLTRTPPGDAGRWAENGRDLLGDRRPGRTPTVATASLDATARLECPVRPVLARHARGGTLLLTDSDACFLIDRDGPFQIRQLPDLGGCSAVATDGAGRLFLGLYDGMVATLDDGEWAYHPADAPVLSLAATPRGLALGDSAGTVTFRDPAGNRISSAVVGEPVVDLASFEAGVVALGARGGLWHFGSGEGGSPTVTTVTPNQALGRPVGLFETGNPSQAGIFGAERVALLGPGGRSLSVGVRWFSQGLRAIAPFGHGIEVMGHPPFGVLTDIGQAWVIDAELKTVAPVLLPEAAGEVVGLAPGVYGGVLAWTAGGSAFTIGRDRKASTLATGDVALAYADPDHRDQIAIVHWESGRGVQVRRLRHEPSR